ncbi:MAG: OmpA family protein [Polyangia bacterium]|nr:OmpA family protein [Polyangia bacterium]
MVRVSGLHLSLVFVCAFLALAVSGCPKKPGTCSKDSDCKPGERCVAGKCQQCGEDKHCGPGMQCINGECKKKPGYCETAKDCPDGKICKDNLCQDCATDQDCPGGRCEKGRCAEQMTGACKVDDDCKDEEVCKDGRCVPAPKPAEGLCTLKIVFFAYNRADIRQEDRALLEENAKCIQSVKDRRVHLNGHCDPRGTEEYNLALSNQRAQSVKRYLQSLGIPDNRLHVVPKGELEASGTDDESWTKDRKVEFVWY